MQGKAWQPVMMLSRAGLHETPWTDSVPGSHGISTGVGCHFLLQGIFPTQTLNLNLLGLLQWQADPLPPHHLARSECSTNSSFY